MSDFLEEKRNQILGAYRDEMAKSISTTTPGKWSRELKPWEIRLARLGFYVPIPYFRREDGELRIGYTWRRVGFRPRNYRYEWDFVALADIQYRAFKESAGVTDFDRGTAP